MKKLIAMTLALASAAAFAGAEDSMVKFGTKGPDKYADGTTVQDGECYVLVCTQNTTTFGGFYADGTVGAGSEIFYVAPIAAGGSCPSIGFQLDAAQKAAARTGTLALYLLDTRSADTGKPMGVTWSDAKQGFVMSVNGWGAVEGATITLGGKQTSTVASTQASDVENITEPPADAPTAYISDIQVVDGEVVISVENTAKYLQYNLSAGDEPTSVSDQNKGKAVQGSGDAITIKREVGTNARFFKLIRN